MRDGDIIFQVSTSAQSAAIQRATRSQWSHVGMIVYRDGKPYVFEAGGTVGYRPLDEWVASGEGGRHVVKRLRGASERITPEAFEKARALLRQLEGKPYDGTFAWSDDRMYCSELVWKVYDRVLDVQVGELQKLRDMDLADPVVQAKLRERYGDKVPLDEPVISPGAMFDSPLLEVVGTR